MEQRLPFPLRGVDSDSGPEFLNWHLLTWLRDRVPAIEVTRSRPYHKNDNAHVEQKNRTHVRELLGEDRLGDPALEPHLIELHTIWSDFNNFFLSTLKLIKKERIAGKTKKTMSRLPALPAGAYWRTGTSEELSASPSLSAAAGWIPCSSKPVPSTS